MGRWLMIAMVWLLVSGPALAAIKANRPIESTVDPQLFSIDEKLFLGAKLDGGIRLVDSQGDAFRLSDKLGKPLILVLSYYQCDGTCSVVNQDLIRLLSEIKRVRVGEDFQVLTLSFDKNDTPETLAAFAKSINLPSAMEEGWTLATFGDAEAIERFTAALGFKFFWSPRDRIFFHPGIYVVLTAEGRVARFLYALNVESKDVALAITEAEGNKISASRAFEYAISLCYSYNFQEGRYTINLPVIIAGASLALGVSFFAISALVFRRRQLKVRAA